MTPESGFVFLMATRATVLLMLTPALLAACPLFRWEEEKKKFWKLQRHKAQKEARAGKKGGKSNGGKGAAAVKGPKPPKKPVVGKQRQNAT